MPVAEYERLPPGAVRDPEAMEDAPPQVWGPPGDDEEEQ
jgi:hypothetical protein